MCPEIPAPSTTTRLIISPPAQSHSRPTLGIASLRPLPNRGNTRIVSRKRWNSSQPGRFLRRWSSGKHHPRRPSPHSLNAVDEASSSGEQRKRLRPADAVTVGRHLHQSGRRDESVARRWESHFVSFGFMPDACHRQGASLCTDPHAGVGTPIAIVISCVRPSSTNVMARGSTLTPSRIARRTPRCR